jgi:hypothetical protein
LSFKVKRAYFIVALVVLVCGIVWACVFWFNDVFSTHHANQPHRAALLQIHDAIEIDASHAEVLAAYWQHRSDALKLHADQPDAWIIRMPLEFGAGDWILQIDFQDGTVSAVRVLTSDGPPPKDGPAARLKQNP